MHGYSIHDQAASAVFEWAAASHRARLRPLRRAERRHPREAGSPSLFDMRFSNPSTCMPWRSRYPSVPIIVPHFGAGYFREALMLADLCPNVYLDTSSSNRWMRYQESHHVEPRAVCATSSARSGRGGPSSACCFGTDSSFFPRGWHHPIFEEQARALYELGLSAEDARAIFGENLVENSGAFEKHI